MNQSQPVFSETRRNVAGIDIAGHADHYVCGPRRDDGTPDIAHFGTATAELHRMIAWLKARNVVSVAMESAGAWTAEGRAEAARGKAPLEMRRMVGRGAPPRRIFQTSARRPHQ